MAVLTGDDQAFSAGANLRDLPRLRDSGPLGPTRLTLTKPVIAAIEGWCVAGGVELAAWCDLRVAGVGSRIGCLERRWGVPLIDGGTYRLPQIVGLGRALDLILTGREIGADEAERMGFVNRVVPDGEALATAMAMASEIASFPWLGVVNDRAASTWAWGSARTRPSPWRTSSAVRRSSPTASVRASTGSTTTKPSETAEPPNVCGAKSSRCDGNAPQTDQRSNDSPRAPPQRSRPPAAVQLLGAPIVAFDALEGGAVDVVGEEVGAPRVAHVEVAQVEEGLAHALPTHRRRRSRVLERRAWPRRTDRPCRPTG